MNQNLIDLKAYDLCLDKNLFNILSLFLIGIFSHFLAAIAHSNLYKWKLGNERTVKPRFTDSFFFVPGERKPLHFL